MTTATLLVPRSKPTTRFRLNNGCAGMPPETLLFGGRAARIISEVRPSGRCLLLGPGADHSHEDQQERGAAHTANDPLPTAHTPPTGRGGQRHKLAVPGRQCTAGA